MSLLEVKQLNLSLRTHTGLAHILKDVSLRVEAGERVALVGETGCGKSLTLKAILGLLEGKGLVVSGKVLFEGEEILGTPRILRLRGVQIGFIPQDPAASLNPTFSIADQLLAVVRRVRRNLPKEKAWALIKEALVEVAVPDPDRVLASYPFQLSGGLCQRVLIAMALVNRPKLVLADEPGTALDVTVQAQTLRAMRHLTEKSGSSVILVTHNLGVVREFADRVYVMYAGTIVEHGPVKSVFQTPRHPYTRALLDSVPRLTGGGLPQGLDGHIPDYTSPPKGCRFRPRCAFARPECAEEQPLRQVAEGHEVACVLYAEVPRG